MLKFEQTGERFIPTQSNPWEVLINIDRYIKAAGSCIDKRVLDLGCGSGLGTYIYSLVAKTVLAVDNNEAAFNYAGLYPFDEQKVSFLQLDLEKELPDLAEPADVTVALEFLEHVSDPEALLAKLPTKELIFSLPLSSMAVSKWHKFATGNGVAGVADVRALIEKSYVIKTLDLMSDRWVFGTAEKKKA